MMVRNERAQNDQAQCIDPSAITPEDRVAYMDGEAGAGVVEHLQRCAYCANEVRTLAATQRQLLAGLYRFDCPTPQRLSDYALELLTADERTRVAAHVMDCPRCADELQTLRTFVSVEPAPQVSPMARLRRLVATLVVPPQGTPAYTTLRGGEAPASQTYRAEDVSLTVTVEAEPQRERYTLAGLVVQEPVSQEHGETASRTDAVHLFRAGQLIGTQALDDLGSFAFEALQAGAYRLEAHLTDRVITVDTIRIGDP